MRADFAVTWDYRCPFARNAHEHLITGLESGADWNVRFSAFSLDQVHVEDGQPAVWDMPSRYPGLTANLAGIVVRDRSPDRFLPVHRALFAARHDEALDLRERDILAKVLDGAGMDADAVLAEVDAGWPLETLRREHMEAVDRLQVFGVPTFIAGDRAVFVRLLDRPGNDAALATRTIDRVVDLLTGWPELNEFKHTSIDR
jgi:protein-disulfide isomerase-like protein with CxxC motif